MKIKKILLILLIFVTTFGLIFSISKVTFLSKKQDQNEVSEENKKKEKQKEKAGEDNKKDSTADNKTTDNKTEEEKPKNSTNPTNPVTTPNERRVLPKKNNNKPVKPIIPNIPEVPTPGVTPTPTPDPTPNPKPNPDPTPNPDPKPNPKPNPDPTPNPDPKPNPKPEEPVEIPAGQAVKTTYEKNGKKITTLWTKGIKPPKMDEFTEEKHNDYLIVTTPYKSNKGWYDTNKSESGHNDRVLCSGAVASNMLHWWLEQNKTYIDRYLSSKPERAILPGESSPWKNLNTYLSSFKNQSDSKIFEMFKLYYGHTNGIWADTSVDFFINGYIASLTGATNSPEKFNRDNRGGFFNEVFGTDILTNRFFSGDYNEFSDAIKKELQKGNIIGLSHRTGSTKSNHIITVWGADFDEKGKIIGIYITDSDDYSEANVGMRRFNVNNKDGRPAITASTKKNVGSNLEYIHTLSLGTDKWEKFFK